MKQLIFVIAFYLMATPVTAPVTAQDPPENDHRNFPIILTIQFHALTLPFHDLKTNFSNIGIGVGTEVSLNGKENWAQQFSLVWVGNQQVGNRIMVYTQTAWRPTLTSNIFSELKLGIGYTIAKRPIRSYKQIGDKWVSVGKQGKGLLTIPAGISLGFSDYSSHTYFSPFTTYQFLLHKSYNQTIPIMPETLIQTGIRIHPIYNL